MRNRNSKLLHLGILLLAAVGFLSDCKKTPPPFQGPKNPSFEVPSSDYEADNWLGSYGGGLNRFRVTGTGFFPSQGLYYENLKGLNLSISQNDVDFTQSKSMTFDYTMTCDTFKQYIDSFTIKMLFTSNGTITLWHQSIYSKNYTPHQIFGKTINLPVTTAPGRLIIQTETKHHSMSSVVSASFCIDNIRVQ